MTRTALFPGSFDPFTIGHKDIADRALHLFDRLIIAVGVNEQKACMLTAEERLEQIRSVYRGDDRVEVVRMTGFTMDFAREQGCSCIVKGVRSVKDFEYEREQADLNLQVGGIDTLIMYCRPELSSVSSSMVRTFKHFGKDYQQFLASPALPNGKE